MLPNPRERIFGKNIDSYLDRSVERPIDLRFEHDQIAHPHGIQKIKMIHRRSDRLIVAVPLRRNRPGNVDQVHDSPTQNISQYVRVLGQH